jgi:hypothetical protein
MAPALDPTLTSFDYGLLGGQRTRPRLLLRLASFPALRTSLLEFPIWKVKKSLAQASGSWIFLLDLKEIPTAMTK